MQKYGFTSGEHRVIHLFKEVGSNIKTYGKDLAETYVAEPLREKDPIKAVAGVPMAAASVILEGTDQLWAGIVDQKIEPASGIAGRTRRDAGSLLKNVVTLHPLRAVGDGFRLAFADVPLDIGDGIFGFHQKSARSKMQYALAA